MMLCFVLFFSAPPRQELLFIASLLHSGRILRGKWEQMIGAALLEPDSLVTPPRH